MKILQNNNKRPNVLKSTFQTLVSIETKKHVGHIKKRTPTENSKREIVESY